MVVGKRAFAGLGFANRDTRSFGEIGEGAGGCGIVNAAACNDEWFFCAADQGGGLGEKLLVTAGAGNGPDTLVEKFLGEAEGFGLDVLREAEGDGAGVGGRGEDAHGFGEGSEELFGTLDAI